MKKTTFLIIAAHPDDAEISLGGTICKLIRQQQRVVIVDLTSGEPTPYGSEDKRRKETARANKVLQITERHNLGLPNRYLFDDKDTRLCVAETIREVRPDFLFCPYPQDAHPDHVATAHIAEAARFYAKLTKTNLRGQPHYPPKCLYYFCTHLKILPPASFFIDISESFKDKMRAIKCYRSQFVDNPKNTRIFDVMETTNHYWGQLNGVSYAEAVYSKEAIMIKDLNTLL
jgi:bacillithiol biosynthesis deacetylase BshB1